MRNASPARDTRYVRRYGDTRPSRRRSPLLNAHRACPERNSFRRRSLAGGGAATLGKMNGNWPATYITPDNSKSDQLVQFIPVTVRTAVQLYAVIYAQRAFFNALRYIKCTECETRFLCP